MPVRYNPQPPPCWRQREGSPRESSRACSLFDTWTVSERNLTPPELMDRQRLRDLEPSVVLRPVHTAAPPLFSPTLQSLLFHLLQHFANTWLLWFFSCRCSSSAAALCLDAGQPLQVTLSSFSHCRRDFSLHQHRGQSASQSAFCGRGVEGVVVLIHCVCKAAVVECFLPHSQWMKQSK